MQEASSLGFVVSHDPVRGERIASRLQPRIIGRADATASSQWRVVHIERGAIRFETGGRSESDEGHILAWIPWGPDSRLRIEAGTVGAHVLLGNTALNNAIGHSAESADLRSLTRRSIIIPLIDNGPPGRTVAWCFDGILREIETPAASSPTMIEAMLRIVLVEIWRAQGAPGAYDVAATPSQRLMNRFQALLGANFRHRWSVAHYAHEIGISADRLTDICRRHRNRSPKQLINARLGAEARLLLENSTHSVDQIAEILNFPSAAQFNRFFSRHHDSPPGAYRRNSRSGVTHTPSARPNLYEWP